MEYIPFSFIRPFVRLATLRYSHFPYYQPNDEGRLPEPLLASPTILGTDDLTSAVRRGWLLILLLLFSFGNLQAQDDSNPKRGFYPGGSYAVGEIETINRADGNLLLNVPLASLPAGRGGMSATLNLTYNNKLWDASASPVYSQHPDYDQLLYTEHTLERARTGGWNYGFQYSWTDEESLADPCGAHGYLHKLIVLFPDGSQHEFRPYGYQDKQGYFQIGPDGWVQNYNQTVCLTQGIINVTPATTAAMTYYSTDGTYMRLEIAHDGDPGGTNSANNPWTLYLPNGGRVVGTPASDGSLTSERIYDSNNNYIDIVSTFSAPRHTQISDQLGRSITIDYAAVAGPNNLSWTDYVTAQGFNNEPLRWSVHFKTIRIIKSYLNCSGSHCPVNDLGYLDAGIGEVDQVTLPAQVGGLNYSFDYNAPDYVVSGSPSPSLGWGELSSVTIPSGSSAAYHYKYDGMDGIQWTSAMLGNFPTRKDLTYQLEYDGTSAPTTDTWLYSFKPNGANNSQITTPDGGVQRDYWYSNTPKWLSQLIYKTEHPDGSITERLWQDNTPSGSGSFNYSGFLQNMNPLVKTDFASIRDSLGNLTKTAIKNYTYDKNGNLTAVSEYEWVPYLDVPRDADGMPTGIPETAVIKKVVANSFYNSTPPASDITTDNPNVYSKPGSPNKRNAIAATEIGNGGSTLARTEFTYDNPSTSGNLTQKTSWDSTKGSLNSSPPYLTSANSVSVSNEYATWSSGETGKLIKATDALGAQTSITYASVGGSELYPTQIQTAYGTSVQRTETHDYDFSTGLITRVTDTDNNVSTSTIYDAVGRPTLVRAAEGKPEERRTSMAYSDLARRVITRADMTALGDGKLVSVQHYDQLGRIRLSRQLEDSASQSETDEAAGIKVQTRYSYSGSNSYQVVSHPYREAASSQAPPASMDWTRSKADNSGRLIEVRKFGGTNLPVPWGNNSGGNGGVTETYNGDLTIVTDQAGRMRRSMTDALGQLVRVDEPDKTNGNLDDQNNLPVQATYYAYDALGNLRTVSQGSQQRFFAYDSMSRLLRVRNPEQSVNTSLAPFTDPVSGNGQWSIAYTYDNNGNLKTRIDPRNITSNYVYDPLNRNTGVTYTNDPANTPAVSRYYDGWRNGVNNNIPNSKGRLWQTETTGESGSRTTIDSFNALGRALTRRQQFSSNGTWSQSYSVSRSYDFASHVITQTYPSGHTVNYAYDSAGRTASFTGNLGEGVPRSYATEFQYNEWGGVQQEKFGTETPLYHKQRFNERGQLWDMRLSTVPYNTDPANGDRGAIVNYYSNNFVQGGTGADNNGNLLRQEAYIPGSGYYQQNYSYDYLNRLTSVSEKLNGAGNDTFKQAYIYDRWGNRTIDQTNTTANVPHPAYTVNTGNVTNNRLNAPAGFDPLSYDDAGNLTQDSTSQNSMATSQYDAENRLALIEFPAVPVCYSDGEGGQTCYPGNGAPSITYVYDGDGRRVRRTSGGGTGPETWQVYGFDGELLSEYPQNGTSVIAQSQKEYGYRNGQVLVTAEPSVNLALNKPATQIDDNAPSTTANKAVDGNADSGLWDGTSSATNYHQNSWWQVDLQSVQTVSSITVWGRTDCCPEMTSNFYVFVSNTPFTSYDLNTTLSQSGVSSYYYPNWSAASSIPVNRTGRYVRVQLAGTQYLVLGEVQVWGGAAQVNWLVTDHLGSPRIIADRTGSTSGISRHDYLPFGDEVPSNFRNGISGYTGGDSVRQKFSQKERDNETGLDYFGARFYSSIQGRFTSPDPLLGISQRRLPQNWNRYAYCLDNPLRYTDPDGMKPRWLRHDGGDGNWYYLPFDDQEDRDGDSPYKDALNNGWCPVQFDETKPYTFSPINAGIDVTLNTDGSFTLTDRPRGDHDVHDALVAGGVVTLVQPEGDGELVAVALIMTAIATSYLHSVHSITSAPPIFDPNLYARKKDLELVDYIAKKWGIDRETLSEEIHERKRQSGRGGADNLGKEEIEKIAEEIKEAYGSENPEPPPN